MPLTNCGDCGEGVSPLLSTLACGICSRPRHAACQARKGGPTCDACYDDASRILDPLDAAIYAEQDRDDWPFCLSKDLFRVWAVYSYQGVTDNGGYSYFFGHDWPRQLPYSVFVNALREVGAEESAECLERAITLFPFPNPERERDRRRAFMESSRSSPEVEDGPIDRLGDRAIELGPWVYHHLARHVEERRLGR